MSLPLGECSCHKAAQLYLLLLSFYHRYFLFIYAKWNGFIDKVCKTNKIFHGQEFKALCWRTRRICYPALHILWLVTLGSRYMCLPHASGIQFLRRYRWRNCACESCQAWIGHGELSPADFARLLDVPRSETLGTWLNTGTVGVAEEFLDAGTLRWTISLKIPLIGIFRYLSNCNDLIPDQLKNVGFSHGILRLCVTFFPL